MAGSNFVFVRSRNVSHAGSTKSAGAASLENCWLLLSDAAMRCRPPRRPEGHQDIVEMPAVDVNLKI